MKKPVKKKVFEVLYPDIYLYRDLNELIFHNIYYRLILSIE